MRALLDGVRVEVTPQALRKVLAERFSADELIVLCADLKLEHENIFSRSDPKENIALKIMESVTHRDQFDALVRYMRRERPGAI